MESRASPTGRGEIEEEELVPPAEAEEKVYVALGKDLKEGKANLLWAFKNLSRSVVIIHVHHPAKMIPILGGKFPAKQLTDREVRAYRQMEKEKLNKSLDEYLFVCSELKVKAQKLVIETDDVAKGLIELIAQHRITKLVMGAAADKHYSKKMNALRSKTAITVKQQADSSCNIWFVCKGSLIYTRETALACGLDLPSSGPSSVSSLNSICGQPEQLKSIALPEMKEVILKLHVPQMQNLLRHRSSSQNVVFDDGGNMSPLASTSPCKTSILPSTLAVEGSFPDNPWKELMQNSYPPSRSEHNEMLSNLDFQSLSKDEKSEVSSVSLSSGRKSYEDVNFIFPHDEMEDGKVVAELYHKLQDAITEAENFNSEAYRESSRHQKSKKDFIDVIRRAKGSEILYFKELNLRKKVEDELGRAKLEIEMLNNRQGEIFDELERTNEQKLELELLVANSNNKIKDLEDKLSAAHQLFISLQAEHNSLRIERDEALRDVENLRLKKEEVPTRICEYRNLCEFSFSEIEQATHSFNSLLKIGVGGSGTVFKGFLRNTTVAIKILNADGMQGRSEFNQEVEILSSTRHPNLVTLIGVCPEALALIYEYLPSGNLEDHLACMSNTPPLSWQARTRIAAEICSALIFLHSSKPHPIVHGDLKPENILLDANLVSKLSDFGLCNFILQSETTTTLYRHSHPKGTFAYMDPEFLSAGDLTPCSDIYSFGVILLRLLTGRPALGIVKQVEETVNKEGLYEIIDPAAGDWPFVQAKKLASLALRCCEINRKNRPDLVVEVWKVLVPMVKAASLSTPQMSFGSVTDDNSRIPNYFICPIFQEVMRDPHIAADGFTYEAEALRGWVDSGHITSPMTNLKLPHCQLIPNRALRSAIQEWLQNQQRNS